MNNPHLISGAARGNVEALLKHLLFAEWQGPAFSSIHDRKEHEIALVTLKLCCSTTENSAALKFFRRKASAQLLLDLERLVFPDKRDNANRYSFSMFVQLVFLLFSGRSDQ